MANKMSLTVSSSEWDLIEIEWKKGNIENIVKKPSELVVDFLKKKALKALSKR